jgi:hypothetical protein
MWPNQIWACGCRALLQQERLLSFAPWEERTAQSSGACRGGARFRLQSTEHQPKPVSVVAEVSVTSRNNIQEFSFWQEELKKMKRFNMTHGFPE